MKLVACALLVVMFTGCAAKKRANAHLVIPPECRGKAELVGGCEQDPKAADWCYYRIHQQFSCTKAVKDK